MRRVLEDKKFNQDFYKKKGDLSWKLHLLETKSNQAISAGSKPSETTFFSQLNETFSIILIKSDVSEKGHPISLKHTHLNETRVDSFVARGTTDYT